MSIARFDVSAYCSPSSWFPPCHRVRCSTMMQLILSPSSEVGYGSDIRNFSFTSNHSRIQRAGHDVCLNACGHRCWHHDNGHGEDCLVPSRGRTRGSLAMRQSCCVNGSVFVYLSPTGVRTTLHESWWCTPATSSPCLSCSRISTSKATRRNQVVARGSSMDPSK